jgi:hypothetical protein
MQNFRLQLDSLISDIDRLIDLTYCDIELIKNAQHARISEHHHEKKVLISRFESNKAILNDSLQQLMAKNPDATLSDILPEEEQKLLDLFKTKLMELHEANKIYSKFVVSMNEFFNSLVSAILPMKEEGYARSQPKPAAFLQVSA